MKQIIKQFLASAFALPLLAFGAGAAVTAMQSATVLADCNSTTGGSNLSLQAGADCSKGNGQQTDLFGQSGVFKTITNVLLFLIGAISVIMLVIGGLRYVVSGGESSAVTAAKNTILYAIVGVIVALLAYAAIAFVIGSFSAGMSV